VWLDPGEEDPGDAGEATTWPGEAKARTEAREDTEGTGTLIK